ncbi:MAG TPA: HAMP domain-containing sensor histidine kinase [Xanthomonadales bacterium]|nr:HAMP domain-containing sensor histidine kinase [Xanthomonadales bacterium]
MANSRNLTHRLGREILLQAVYISLAVIVSVFAASKLIESVLMKQAISGEAEYYWIREHVSPNGPLPDTRNLTGYRESFGDGIPAELGDLELGFHKMDEPRETLVYVSEQNGQRLYLVFESGRVDRLILLFGLVPLVIVLIVIYISLYAAWRVSRKAVSPIVSLAEQVTELDPAQPDASVFRLETPSETDDEIRVLSKALEDLVGRVTDFAEREREFTRDASHELRTPLTVIKMAADRLLKNPSLDKEQTEYLLRIRNSVKDMQRLTMAFLMMAREEDSALPTEWVNVNEIAAAELDRFEMMETNSTIATHLNSEGNLLVRAPEKVLESVIGNLIRNALMYTEEGQVNVEIDSDSITIEDTGPGMTPEEVEKVFQPFFRKERTRGGFGVGLTIVKRLTERFDWPIEVDSEVGRGTRVKVGFSEAQLQDT